jgi:AcrR family transcriptional regulator
VPRLWTETLDEHRRAVRDATLDAAAALIAEHGLAAVTMSQIAEATGIARATLYRYFPDVEAVLLAWHERQVARHLEQLVEVSQQPGRATVRLTRVLETYAHLSAHHHGPDFGVVLHRGGHVEHARHRLRNFVCDLIAEGVATDELRDDVPAEDLAAFCLHALGAAQEMSSPDAVRRLVAITIAGLLTPH